MYTLMQEACTTGQFCQQTHKQGLCKGQHRGDAAEPNSPVQVRPPGDQAKVAHATQAVAGLNQAILRTQAILASSPDPKTRQAAARALADYRKQLAPHLATMRQQAAADKQHQTDVVRRRNTAIGDEKQQDRLDKAAAKKKAKAKAKGGGTALKPYQTSTKI